MTTERSADANRDALLAIRKLRAQLAACEGRQREPIAVVGLSCRFPGAPDAEAYWSLLERGGEGIVEVPGDRWDVAAHYDPDPDVPGKMYVKRGGFIDSPALFDAAFFGIAPQEADSMDPQQRLLLEQTWQALESAGIAPGTLAGTRTGVFVGITSLEYSMRMQESGVPLTAHTITGNALNAAAGRLSFVLRLAGPAIAIDTACSSSLVAVHQACQSLRTGESNVALAAGVNLILTPTSMIATCSARMLSPDGRCNTFDASANGFARGEGCGVVVLKRLSDAERAGDRVLAVIRGTAVNQDGHSSGFTVPSGPAQQRVIRDALERAGVSASAVRYLECHGTGTSLGDPIEVQAANAVYAEGRSAAEPLLLGSAKTNIGHLEAAAGIAGLIKLVLALGHDHLPRHLNLKTPNPHIPWEELTVRVVTSPTAWPTGRRLAAVSSFGFSGTNAHAVLEAYEAPTPPAPTEAAPPARGRALLVLSARCAPSLRALGASYAQWLTAHAEADLGDVCHSANSGREALEHRAGLVVGTLADLRAPLEALAAGESAPGLIVGRAPRGGGKRKVGFLFTGQGAQYVGMGRALYESEPVFRAHLDRCAAVFDVGRDASRPLPLLEAMGITGEASGSDAWLHQTTYTQPALYVLETGLAAQWRAWGVEPDVVLGHSVGEYAAAAVAGVFDLEDGLRLIAERARLMQALPEGGAMISLEGDAVVIEAAAADVRGVDVAAYNGAGTVLSGEREALEAVVGRLTAQGLRAKELKTSHAFHSARMAPMLEAFGAFAAGLTYRAASRRLVSNVSGELLDEGRVLDAAYWTTHIRAPVRFAQGMDALARLSCEVLLEVGPHPVLTTMGQRRAETQEAQTPGSARETVWVGSLRRARDARESLLEAAAQLYTAGVALDVAALDAPWHATRRKVSLPLYPFDRQRYWIEEPERAHTVPAAATLSTCVYQVAWERLPAAPPVSASARASAHWLIITDAGGVGAALARTLEAQGQRCVCGLASEAPSLDAAPFTHVVHLGGLDGDGADLESLRRAQACGVHNVLALVQAMQTRQWQGRLWLVTRGTQRVLDSDSIVPAQAPIWGMGKVVSLEYPAAWGGLIDLPLTGEPASLAETLASTLLNADLEDQVALRNGERWVARLQRQTQMPAPVPMAVRAEGTYLITGGLGGIGLQIAGRLVERGARHLVLSGRRAPGEAARATVAQLEAAGCHVDVRLADIAQASDVVALFDALTEPGRPPLRGLVHAAGVEGIAALGDVDDARLEKTLAAKVYGGWLLDRETTARGTALDFFVCISSIASVWGSVMQAAYAAANAFLDSLGGYRRALGRPATVMNYGPWAQVGMGVANAEATEWLSRRGVRPLEPALGLNAFEAAVAGGLLQSTVLDVAWEVFRPVLEVQRPRPLFQHMGDAERHPERTSTAEDTTLVAALKAAPEAERLGMLKARFRDSISRALGRPAAEFSDNTGFFDLGMDSLMAVEFRNGMTRVLGHKLPATVLMDRPDLDRLAAYVLAEVLELAPRADAASVGSPTPSGSASAEPIAVVGLSCRFPGAPDAQAYWSLLERGGEGIVEVPDDRWDVAAYYDPDPDAPGKMYVKRGGFIESPALFDAAFFGIAPREAESMDPQQRMLLEQSWQALESAGIAPATLAGTRTGVYLGISASEYGVRMQDSGVELNPYAITGNALNAAAGRLAFVLRLEGPALAIDTACSSSLVAVHQACLSLRAGECNVALAAGVNLILTPKSMLATCSARMLSPDGRCKTFDAAADGYARGEGCGVVVLKRLSDAEQAGDRVLAVIRGTAVNQDGHSSGFTVPSGPAQQRVIRDALERAGVSASAVRYLECHGTGTSLGDPIEVQAANAVYAEGRSAAEPLLLGSAKTNLGHLEAAAGIAGLIKLVLALGHDHLPRHLNLKTPNPHIPWDELAVRVVTSPTAWPAGRRLAAVSSFGFSGTNAHAVLEAYEAPVASAPAEAPPPARGRSLLVLSARSAPSLRALGATYAQWLTAHAEADLGDVCHSANSGREALEHRAGLVVGTLADLRAPLEALAAGENAPGLVVGRAPRGGGKRKVAFLFTGQGAQYVGMGRALYESEPVFRAHLDRCAAVFDGRRDASRPLPLLEAMGITGGASESDAWLHQTTYTQPALYVLETGLAAQWRAWGVEPDVVLGHSVGEYAAAAVAGVFDLEDGLRLIAERARLMQALPEGGAMVSLEGDAAVIEAAAAGVAGVDVAAYNGAGTVLSGERAALDAVVGRLTAQGMRAKELKTSHAFHSARMEPMLEAFGAFAASLSYRPATRRLVSNVSGELLEDGRVLDAAYWTAHIRAPVRFAQGMEALSRLSCEVLLEVGPHPVLTTMGQRRTEASESARETVWVGSLRRARDARESLLEAAANLYTAGVAVDITALDAPWRAMRRKVSLPLYPFERQRYWIEEPERAHPVSAAATLATCVYQVAWERLPIAPPVSSSARASEHWLIVADAGGVGAALARALEAQGQRCVCVMASEAPPLEAAPFAHVVHLASLDGDGADFVSLHQAQMRGVHSALSLVQVLHARQWEGRLWLVTRQTQRVLDTDAVAPAQAPVWGLGKVVSLEYPAAWGGLIDLPLAGESEPLAAELAATLLNADLEDQVALRGGERWVARLQRQAPMPAPVPMAVRAEGAYLITGGLGGIGLQLAGRLVERGARHLVLSGRRAPEEAARAALAQLEAMGCHIDVRLADIAQESDVVALFDALTEPGRPPLRGIIHAAGVTGIAALGEVDGQQLEKTLAAKVYGGWLLDRETTVRGAALDFFVCISSIASVWGSFKQAAYAAANAFLDSLGGYRRALGRPATVLNYGLWAQVGMGVANAEATEWLSRRGMRTLDPTLGLDAFEAAVAGGRLQTTVVDVAWEVFRPVFEAQSPRPLFQHMEGAERRPERTSASEDTALVAALKAAPESERTRLLKTKFREAISHTLGRPAAELSDNTGFFDLGMDSLMAVEFRNGMTRVLGRKLPATVLMDQPDLDRLAAYVLTEVLQLAPRVDAASDRRPATTGSGSIEPIAVVGLSCRFPGAPDAQAYWSLLERGGEGIVEVPGDRWDVDAFYDPDPDAPGKMYVKRGGFIESPALFDAAFFGIAPREAESMDPQQRMLLEQTWQALESAGIAPGALAGTRTGVFLGISSGEYSVRMQDSGVALNPYAVTGNGLAAAAGRVAFVLRLAGPALAIDTACSSSLVAVHQACQSLRTGESNVALAAGVNLILTPKSMLAACSARMLSPDGRCKTFDASADGYGRGEGCGVVVLKRLSDAERAGDRVLAVIRGTAVNQDGHSSGFTVPSGPAQQSLIRDALERAGVSASAVRYLECHGTGTSLGDPIEVQAANAVYAEGRSASEPLLLGSAKTNIGHLEAAAGIAGLIKLVLALGHDLLPRHLNLKTPNPHIPWEELSVRVVTSPTAWPAGRRLAAVSSFGFSGTNAHAVLEAYEAPVASAPAEAALPERGRALLVLSARSAPSLRALGASYAQWLTAHAEADLGDVCHSANSGREALEYRAGLVVGALEELRAPLEALAVGESAVGRLIVGRSPRGGGTRTVGFLFTGQGAQYLGMGRALYESEPVFRAHLDRCAAVFDAGRDATRPLPLLEAMGITGGASGADAWLHQTTYTQPALYVLETGLAAQWRAWGVEPDVVLGHSVGEYAAAAVAGVFDLEDGLRLIAERARLMQALPEGGAMVSLEGDSSVIEAAAVDVRGVDVAAYNGSGTVLSGEREALEAVVGRLTAQGMRAKELKTSHAFHSARMEPMLEAFGAFAAGLTYRAATRRLVSNVSGELLEEGRVLDAAYWTAHIRAPVRFAQGMDALNRLSCEVLLEVGPHPVLTTMGQRRAETQESQTPESARETVWVGSLRRARDARESLLEAAAQLYTAGVTLDVAALDAPWRATRRKLSLPLYPFERHRFWIEELERIEPIPAAATLESCLYRLTWERKEAVAAAPAATAAEHWLILADAQGVGVVLAQRLEAEGRRVACVLASESPPLEDAPYTHVVHLGSLDGIVAESGDALRAAQACGVQDARRVAQALLARHWQGRLWLVTRGTQQVLDADHVEPAQCPVWGLGKAIAMEHPQLWGGLLDLALDGASGADCALALAAALAVEDAEDEVALRAGGRWVARLERQTSPPSPSVLRPKAEATYLITGGLGGVGLLVAQRLVARGARALMLVGRRPPSESATRVLDELRARGCVINVQQADLSREADVVRVLDVLASERLPPLDGVVHAAGDSSQSPLAELDAKSLESALGVKVYGSWWLHQHTRARGMPLSFFVMTSSIAAVWGTVNQSAYAAANAFLAGLATRRVAEGLPASTIAYGPWREVGMMAAATEQGVAWLRRNGIGLLTPDLALDGLEAQITARLANVVIAKMDWKVAANALREGGHRRPLLSSLVAANTHGDEATPATSGVPAEWLGVSSAERIVMLTQLIRDEMTKVLGLQPERIQDEQSFFDQGMDSLMAVEFRNALTRRLHVRFPVPSIYEHGSVRRLSVYLDAVVAAQQPASSGGAGPASPHDVSPSADGQVILSWPPYTARHYVPADRDGILSLMREVFGEAAAANAATLWDWKYDRNPFNTAPHPFIIVVERDGQIVATHGAMSSRLKLGADVHPLLWGTEVQVHPQHKAAGGLLAAAVAAATPETLLGMPNEQMLAILQRSGDLAMAVRLLNHTSIRRALPVLRSRGMATPLAALSALAFDPAAWLFRTARRAVPASTLSVEPVLEFDDTFNTFWQRVSGGYEALSVRDQAYLTWRFIQCPNRTYTIHAVRRGSELAGYIVFRDVQERGVHRGIIADLLTESSDRDAMAALIASAVQTLTGRGVDKIECVVAAPRAQLRRVLRRQGQWLPVPVPTVLVCLNGPRQDRVQAVRNWHLTISDSDLDVV